MALLLKSHVFQFFMPNFFFITGLNPGKIWRSIKSFINWICMNQIVISLLVIKLASIKFATYSQRIVSLSLMKDNNISSDGCTRPQLSEQCIDRAQCTHLLIKFKFKLNFGSISHLKNNFMLLHVLPGFQSIDTEEIRHVKLESVLFLAKVP